MIDQLIDEINTNKRDHVILGTFGTPCEELSDFKRVCDALQYNTFVVSFAKFDILKIEEAKYINELIKHNRSINKLFLWGDKSIEFIKHVGLALKENTVINILHLRGVQLDTEEFKYINDIFKFNKVLEEVHIYGNIDIHRLSCIIDALEMNLSITTMIINHYNIPDIL